MPRAIEFKHHRPRTRARPRRWRERDHRLEQSKHLPRPAVDAQRGHSRVVTGLQL